MEPDLIGQEKGKFFVTDEAKKRPQWSLTSSVRKSWLLRPLLSRADRPAMEPDLIGQEKACGASDQIQRAGDPQWSLTSSVRKRS